MKMFRGAVLVLIVFVNFGEIYSAPVDNSKTETLYSEYNLNPDGSYNYKYKLSDGQAVDVEGKLSDVDGSPIYRVKGLYTFEGTDRKVYTINYVADENGYRTSSEKPEAPRPTPTRRPVAVPTYRVPPSPTLKPGAAADINPRTIAGTFG